MKQSIYPFIFISLAGLCFSSCKKENLFVQPTIEVTGYTLKELPGEFTYLDIDMILTNNDTREVQIKDVDYQVVIEGFSSGNEQAKVGETILADTPLELTLPLTLVTTDAIQLLSMR